jgi:hypothetical protein
MNNPELEALRAFRPQVYRLLGQRRDALFELRDASLTAAGLESPVHLSLDPSFQRCRGSIYDTLNAGTMDLATGGRPRRHGAKFVCEDPTTWPESTDEWRSDDPQYGRVWMRAWSGMHVIPQNHAKRGTRQTKSLISG